jgi:hypothetical protein
VSIHQSQLILWEKYREEEEKYYPPSYVYIIKQKYAHCDFWIKVGKSQNPERRLVTLNADAKRAGGHKRPKKNMELELWVTIPGAGNVERLLRTIIRQNFSEIDTVGEYVLLGNSDHEEYCDKDLFCGTNYLLELNFSFWLKDLDKDFKFHSISTTPTAKNLMNRLFALPKGLTS